MFLPVGRLGLGARESSARTTSAAISCFFNKRKRNVIVLFVSTFKNTTLALIPGSPSGERTRERERNDCGAKREKNKRGMGRDTRGRKGRMGEKREWKEYLRRY